VARLWQYQSQAKPVTPPGAEAENVHPEAWQHETDRPDGHWKKAALYSVAALAPFLAFVDPFPQITPFPAASNPVQIVEMRTTQYQQVAQPTFVPASAEVITVDKWHPSPQPVPADVKRTQYLYPVSVIDPLQLTQHERITPDKWQPETNRPLFTRPALQYLDPVSSFGDEATQFSETITVDKWQPETNKPRFDIQRTQYLYPTVAVQPISTTYTERITPDKWLGYHPEYLFDLKRTQYLAPVSTLGPKPLPNTEIITADKWQPVAPAFVPDTKRQQFLAPVSVIDPLQLTQHERITIDKWFMPTQLPLFDVKRTQVLTPSLFLSPTPPSAPSTAVVAFGAQDTPVVFTRTLLYQSLSLPLQALTSPIVTVDKWQQETNKPRFDVVRTQYLAPVSAFVNPFPNITPFPAASNPVQIVEIRTTQYQQMAKPIFVPASSEVITADKWQPVAPALIPDVKRWQYLAPIAIIDPVQMTLHERITLDKWAPQRPDILFDVKRVQYLYPVSVIDPITMTRTERITPDKWLGYHPDVLFDIRHWQALYPTNFPDPLAIQLNPAPIEIDKYDFNNDQPIFRAPNIAYTYPVMAVDPTIFLLKERITLDKWLPQLPPFIWRVNRLHYLNPAFAYARLPAPIVIVMPDKWYPQLPMILFERRRWQMLYPGAWIDPTAMLIPNPPAPPFWTDTPNPTGMFSKTANPSGVWSTTPQPSGSFTVTSAPSSFWTNITNPTSRWG
jgi:hypothetical protein